MANERRTHEPIDRLTRMADSAVRAFEAHPEYRAGDRCAIFLDDQRHGGIVMHGYEHDGELVADLLIHLRAIMRSAGKDLQIHAMGTPDPTQN